MSGVPEQCPARGSRRPTSRPVPTALATVTNSCQLPAVAADYRRLRGVRPNISGGEASQKYVSVRKRTGLVQFRPTLSSSPAGWERGGDSDTTARRVTCSLRGTHLKRAVRRRRNRSQRSDAASMSKSELDDEGTERSTDDERTNVAAPGPRRCRRCQRCRFDLVLSLFDGESPICRKCEAKEARR